MKTNKQLKREERQRQKDMRRRHRQEAEWKKACAKRRALPQPTVEEQIKVLEAKDQERRRRSGGILGLATALTVLAAATPKEKT